MPLRTYTYTADGYAAKGQTWLTSGQVTADWPTLWLEVNRDVFYRLTEGKARYGQPGVGCRGPYTTRYLAITLTISQGDSHAPPPTSSQDERN